MKSFVSILGKAVVAGALVSGMATVISQGAFAQNAPATYFAAPNGSSSNAPCTTSAATPCDLATAVTEEATLGDGGTGNVISLAAGTYTTSMPLASGNSFATIKGANLKKTILTAAAGPVVSLGAGVNNVTITKLTVRGATANGASVVDAGGANDVLSTVNVVGAAPSGIPAPPSAGVNVAAGSLTLNSVNVAGASSKACVMHVKNSNVNFGGWSGTAVLTGKVPACAGKDLTASGGAVSITTAATPPVTVSCSAGTTVTGASSLQLTGADCSGGIPSPAAIGPHSIVNFQLAGSGIPAYSSAGVSVTGGALTMSGGSVVGNAEPGSAGISLGGGTSVVTGVSVTGGNAAGINVSAGTNTVGTTGHGNSISGNGVGINVAGGTDTLTGNTVGATADGITLNAPATVSGNTVSNILTGPGIALVGINGATVSGNTVTGNGVGIIDIATGANGNNTISGNTVTGNLSLGIDINGPAGPGDLGGAGAPIGGATVSGNTVSNNGTTSQAGGANIADFNAYGGPNGPAASNTTLTYNGAAVAIGGAVTLPLAVSNPTGSPVVLSQGEALQIGAVNELESLVYVDHGITVPANSTTTVTVSLIVSIHNVAVSAITTGDAIYAAGIFNAGPITNSYSTNSGTCSAGPILNKLGVPLTTATGDAGGYYDC